MTPSKTPPGWTCSSSAVSPSAVTARTAAAAGRNARITTPPFVGVGAEDGVRVGVLAVDEPLEVFGGGDGHVGSVPTRARSRR